MKKILTTLLFYLLANNVKAFDDYILQVKAKAENAKTENAMLDAYEKWLPLAIQFHHPEAEKDLEKFKKIAVSSKTEIDDGIYNLNFAYLLVEYYGDYVKGLDYCIKAKEIFEHYNAKAQLVTTYNRLAFMILWNQIGNKKAISNENINDKYLSKALIYARELRDTSLEVLTLSFIGSYFNVVEKDNAKALKCFFEAKSKLSERVPPDLVLVIMESIAIVYADIPDEENAMNYLHQCESLPLFTSFGYGRSNMYRSIAKMYLTGTGEKKFEKALSYAKKSYKISLEMNAPEYISQGENRLFEIYKEMGDTKNALYYHEKYKHHEDSLSREKFQRTYSEYDNVKKESLIKNLENSELKTKAKYNKLIGGALLAAIIIGSGFGFYIFKNNRILKRKNEQLNNKNKEIKEALTKGQHIERKRVAADLHDHLGVQANAILYNAELLKQNPDNREKLIETLNDSAKEMLLILRETLWVMKHTDIEAINLWLRIVNVCSQMSRTYKNIQIKPFNKPPDFFKLEATKALHVVMIVQEVINNAVKHSHCSYIHVSSHNLHENIWQIEIEDNGIGFLQSEVETKNDCYGLKNIEERAKIGQLTVDINSVINKGTWVKILINKDEI